MNQICCPQVKDIPIGHICIDIMLCWRISYTLAPTLTMKLICVCVVNSVLDRDGKSTGVAVLFFFCFDHHRLVFSFGQVQKDIGDVEHGRSENVSSVHHTGNSHQQEVWGYEVQCHWCLWQPHIKILSILSTKSLCYIFKPTAIETEYRGPPVRMTTLPPRLCFSAPSLPCHVPNPHCCWG